MTSVENVSRWLAVGLVALWLVPVAVAAEEVAADSQQEEQAKPKPKRARPGAAQSKAERDQMRAERKARRAELKAKSRAEAPVFIMWWNEAAIVENLDLSEGLRKEFDAILIENDTNRPERGSLERAKRDHHEALRAGDWNEAEAQLAEWARLTAQPIETLGQIKVKVLSKLSDAQREKLVNDYASIVVTKWTPRVQWSPRKRKAKAKAKPVGEAEKKAE